MFGIFSFSIFGNFSAVSKLLQITLFKVCFFFFLPFPRYFFCFFITFCSCVQNCQNPKVHTLPKCHTFPGRGGGSFSQISSQVQNWQKSQIPIFFPRSGECIFQLLFTSPKTDIIPKSQIKVITAGVYEQMRETARNLKSLEFTQSTKLFGLHIDRCHL